MSPSKNAIYFVYGIKSLATGRIYIGQTRDCEGRLREHNAGSVRSTKKHRPWELYAWQQFMSRKEAMYIEWRIKRSKGLREKWLEANNAWPLSLAIES
jgi:predicted GIY-YIG superfamily endonuclease